MPLLATLRLWRLRIWAALLAALAAGLCLIPLLDLLSYEFCLVMSLAGSLAALHLGSVQVAEARGRDEGMVLSLHGPLRALLSLLARVTAANLLLLVVPLLLITANALRIKNCNYLEGLIFYLFMPVFSVALSSVVGALWALALRRPLASSLAAVLTMAASLVWGLWRFYDSPSVFAYDPFIGYFPGTIYDEAIALGPTFFAYRVHNLCWLAAAALGAAALLDPAALELAPALLRTRWRQRRFLPLLLGAAGCLGCGAALFALRAPLGFAVDAAHIAGELGGTRRTAHFVIHYPVEMDPGDVALMARDHEHRHRQLARFFGEAPPQITSYIFRSAAEKQRLMGAGRTFIAKPWRREVYLQDMGYPHPVLKHELAHVFAGLFGDRLLGISLRWRRGPLPHPGFNVGLIEGLAVAADWRPYGEATGHQLSAAMRRIGLAPPVRDLFGAGFLTQAAGRAYTLAGSFCRFLYERHGAAPLLAAFRSGGDFQAAFGVSLNQLLTRWVKYLDALDVPALQLQLAEERFRRPGIVHRVCGHEVAQLNDQADRLEDLRDFQQALALRDRVCAFEPADPGHHLARVRTLVAARELERALAQARLLLGHPALSRPMRRQVMELTGDLHWWAGRGLEAARAYREAGALAADPSGRRVLSLKLWGLDMGGEVGEAVQRYIAPSPGARREAGLEMHLAHRLDELVSGKTPAPSTGSVRSSAGLGLYLVGKQLHLRGHHAEAVAPLARALLLGLPGRDFVVEARFTQGKCQQLAGKSAAAAGTFRALLGMSLPAGTDLEVRDWLDRAGQSRQRAVTAGKNSTKHWIKHTRGVNQRP